MTAQEAAYKILLEAGKPLLSREIAQLALDKSYVSSSAKDPIFSIANTIEKNIRGGIYNSTQLVFVKTTDGRKIGLPSMNKETDNSDSPTKPQLRTHKMKVTVELHEELINQVQLAYQAKLANSYDETIAMLIKKGLSSYASEIRERLFTQLENF